MHPSQMAINNYMEDDVPKKPTRKSSSKSTSRDINSKQFEQMLKDALMDYSKSHQRKTNDTLDSVNSVLEEFMQCFIMLGYDEAGKPMTLVNARSQRDADALSTALSRFFMQHNHND